MFFKNFNFLTLKPMLYVANISKDEIADYWAGYEQNEDGGFHKEY